ncbi:MAG: RNA pyrophosphohydrolase [Gammaproteobacteria bacterium]|nr:RNA pyrophosphohydrolase [Gammaproteobacteria bacterium]
MTPDGYRPNVGIILCNRLGQVFWARRVRHDGWQFPQGGMREHESPEDALFRELYEETGLRPEQVEVVARTADWLSYDLPQSLRRGKGNFRGQKQLWFLLRLREDDRGICLDASGEPEFDAWRWVDYWKPLDHIVEFKREVYRNALAELEPFFEGLAERDSRSR